MNCVFVFHTPSLEGEIMLTRLFVFLIVSQLPEPRMIEWERQPGSDSNNSGNNSVISDIYD